MTLCWPSGRDTVPIHYLYNTMEEVVPVIYNCCFAKKSSYLGTVLIRISGPNTMNLDTIRHLIRARANHRCCRQKRESFLPHGEKSAIKWQQNGWIRVFSGYFRYGHVQIIARLSPKARKWQRMAVRECSQKTVLRFRCDSGSTMVGGLGLRPPSNTVSF